MDNETRRMIYARWNEECEVERKALEHFGIKAQQDKTIEEMAELTQAILKCRTHAGREEHDNLIEEIADVSIMTDQLRLNYGAEVGEMRKQKLERLKKRMEEET